MKVEFMDKNEARRYAKERLEEYLAAKGLGANRKPFHCLNPEHPDKNPSMSFDRRRRKVHCFSCGADYDIFDLVGLDYGLTDTAEIFQKTYEILGLEVEGFGPREFSAKLRTKAAPIKAAPPASAEPEKDYTSYFKKAQKNLGQTGYPSLRGLSAPTAAHFGLGFDPKFKAGNDETWEALIIPTGSGSFTARNTSAEADKTRRVRKRGGGPLFNTEVLWSSERPVFVAEGEIDAMCFHEAKAYAVALGSTANVGAFLKLAESRPPGQPLLLALDNDDEGRKASEKLALGLTELGLKFYQVNPYGDSKDAGEALLRDPDNFRDEIEAAEGLEKAAREAERKAYFETSAAYHLSAFKNGIADSVNTRHIPTGFAGLDSALDGGLFEGLYIMGGISSLGKTSLALQLSDQMAQGGEDVLIFSLEMARTELMAKSVSRLTLLIALDNRESVACAKTARGITCGSRYGRYSVTEKLIIDQAMERYEDFAHRVFISEGVGDIGVSRIRREVEKHFFFTGRRPVVLVDYLQILAPHSDRATDKQNTDKAVIELKRLSRDYKIPVIGLSSFNRANYREAVTMEAFKESGAIEYSSDVLIGLQLKGAGEKDFDALAAKDKTPREVELVILKNRHGAAGKKIAFEYYSMFNYFREQG
ncbi:DNA primase (plasmid) [Deltaproteobacteria bacterium Smac51]|nr:DNA primase [Deltaproteobacteria bacterium Smac51]